MKQTKMYVCTLKNIYSSRSGYIAVQVGTELHWKCCSLYTIATMDEKCEINS